MTHDRIFELAIAAELIDHRDTAESLPPDFVASLKEFATLVRAAALEEAAEVCEVNADRWPGTSKVYAAMECAAAIRALKEKP